MPLVRITYPRGALSPDHKRRIARALTEIVLDVEVGRTVSALDVAQFINSDLDPARRAEIAASVAPSSHHAEERP